MLPTGLKLITPPTAEPVSLADARARLRVVATAEDADLLAMIAEARAMAEGECGRQFLTATYSLVLDGFPTYLDQRPASVRYGEPRRLWDQTIRLPRPPCQSVTWVKYYDPNGVQQTLDPSAYILAASGEPARLVPVPQTYWPGTQYGRPEAVEVRFVAGYGDTAAAVPREAKAAILDILAHRFQKRGDEAAVGIPPTARRLLDQLEYGECR